MTHRQLVTIRDSIQKIRDEYSDKLSNDTKVDFDETLTFLSNIISDVEKERKIARVPYVIYSLRVELMKQERRR